MACQDIPARSAVGPRISDFFASGENPLRHIRRVLRTAVLKLRQLSLPALAVRPKRLKKLKYHQVPAPLDRWKYSHNHHHHHHHCCCFITMALLAASRTAPSVSLSQRSDVMSTLYPLVNTAVQFQQLIGSAAFHLVVRTYFAATVVATVSLWASRSIAWRAFLASRILVARTFLLTKHLAWTAWDSKGSRRFRKRLEFELFILLLGPGGNTLFLMLFWPGWLMLAFLGWGVWHLTG